MKTPDYRTFVVVGGGRGGGKTLADLVNAHKRSHQLESTYSQVSKALCGKENATPEEVLKAVDQLKSRLAQVERERDAAVDSIHGQCEECVWNQTMTGNCIGCVHNETAFMPGIDNWQWRGVCEENTKEDTK